MYYWYGWLLMAINVCVWLFMAWLCVANGVALLAIMANDMAVYYWLLAIVAIMCVFVLLCVCGVLAWRGVALLMVLLAIGG